MFHVIDTESLPIKIWADEVEEGALVQARNLANLPFAFSHIALMPDVHEGFGMPIGGVLATVGAIIPNAVGVDIGCGMCALKTSLTQPGELNLKALMSSIRSRIPLGFKHHACKEDSSLLPSPGRVPRNGIVEQEYENAREQIGTLGGGNHFIEIQQGSDGHIWIMIHSGSRNIGHRVAEHYNRLAKELNTKWKTGTETSANLAFLPLGTEEAEAYIREMDYCVDFAYASRRLMMDRIESVFYEQLKGRFKGLHLIHIAHNYASREEHFGREVMVHRKGATRAAHGEEGIIPGSQGTQSFIVRGRGNEESFQSCSHGAGRLMGRKQAQRTLDLKTEKERLDRQGIIHSIRTESDLDEAPGAYKNIQDVIRQQHDLVEVVTELKPLAVIKG